MNALKSSLRPRARPDDLDTTPAPQAHVSTRGGDAPDLPVSADVSREATQTVTYDPTEPLVLGVFGSDASRSALLRLPNGRTLTVHVGDKVTGAPVVAIADDSIVIASAGIAKRLTIPGA
ncbi:hypothetical protein [Oceanicola sp. 22II-s10i]|uniref:hypothetical protein n=1 Tax=Oceanicola sp. 22II-s10i TaxID=1317116 RepID=UPI00113086D5|nr:hypothetical protein [Oceanicola sp. 22II-s10i]